MLQIHVVKKIKTRYMLNDIFYENHAVCKIMWKNAGYLRLQKQT